MHFVHQTVTSALNPSPCLGLLSVLSGSCLTPTKSLCQHQMTQLQSLDLEPDPPLALTLADLYILCTIVLDLLSCLELWSFAFGNHLILGVIAGQLLLSEEIDP